MSADIKGFFDNIDWDLLLKAVRKHTNCRWLVLYIERWLKADVLMPDGTLFSRGGFKSEVQHPVQWTEDGGFWELAKV